MATVPKLLAITGRQFCGGVEGLPGACAELLEAGLPALMLREKDLDGAALFALATALRRLTSKAGALLIVNDRVDVALAVGADGVHLGSSAIPALAARRICPPGMLIGASCHSREELARAEATGADYAVLSPVYAPTSKEATLPPLGEAGFRSLAGKVSMPVMALGGITAENAGRTMQSGAAGVAVLGGIFQATDRVEAMRGLLRAVKGA